MSLGNNCRKVLAAALALIAGFPAAAEDLDWTRMYAVESPVLSANGDTLYFGWCGTNWTASVTGGIARACAKIPKSFDAGEYTNKMDAAQVNECRVSPDGKRVICRFRGDDQFRLRRGTTSSRAGEIWLYDATGDSWTNLVCNQQDNNCPSWLGDYAFAYLHGTGRGGFDVRRFHLKTGADSVLIPSEADDGEVPQFMCSSADGRTLVVRRGFDMWCYRLDEAGAVKGRAQIVLRPESSWNGRKPVRERWYKTNWNNSGYDNVAPVADGKDIIFTAGGDLWAVKPGKGTNVVCRLWCGEGRIHAREPVVSNDGRILYYLLDYGDKTEIWSMWRLDETKPWHEPGELEEKRLHRRDGMVAFLCLSPDNTRISWTEDSTKGIFVCSTNEGAKAEEITPRGTLKHWERAWSPDGRYMAVAAADKDRNIDVWVIPMAGTNEAVNVSDHMLWDGEPSWSTNSSALAFNADWGDGNIKRMFKVDMAKPLRKGCAEIVPVGEEKPFRGTLVKVPDVQMPYFRAEQSTVMTNYQELAFLTIWSRLGARFILPNMNGVDWNAARAKYLPAAKHAPSWKQFQRVVLQMLGELDASHLSFYSTKDVRTEWSLPSNDAASRDGRQSVAELQDKVHSATSNRWGYVRVKNMEADSYCSFLNDLFREGRGREGIILDIRGNTGGNKADLMLQCLMTPPHGYGNWQNGGKGYSMDHLGRVQFSGRVIALIDEDVYSNGEMFAHALKSLKRATLVGRATSGSVLATQNHEVLDWGEFRVPYGRWFTEDGVEMENHGAEPDVRVDDTPADWMRGVDVQLERAIRLAN